MSISRKQISKLFIVPATLALILTGCENAKPDFSSIVPHSPALQNAKRVERETEQKVSYLFTSGEAAESEYCDATKGDVAYTSESLEIAAIVRQR